MCPGRPAGASQDVAGPLLNVGRLGQQDGGIQVALDRDVLADQAPGDVEIHAPVHADDVAARFAHVRQQVGGAGAEVDDGRPRRQPLEQGPHVRLDERRDSRRALNTPTQESNSWTASAPAAIWPFR